MTLSKRVPGAMIIGFLPILVILSGDVAAGSRTTVDGQSVRGSDSQTIVVQSDDCRILDRHQRGADVEYQPGVDVRGREVAPADLAPHDAFAAPSRDFGFAVIVDLEDRLGVNGKGQDRPVTGEGVVGYVDVRDGVVRFNGAPLSPAGSEAVDEACHEFLDKDKKDR